MICSLLQKKIMRRTIQSIIIALMSIAPVAMHAQAEHGFKAIAVEQDFTPNGFNWFRHALLLAAGNEKHSNAMTIGWGSMGNYLGYKRPTVTVYVAPGRYTYQFMERYPRFTIMEFDNPDVARYMGSHSGRDGDKAAALGLHVAYTPSGTPYYTEAKTVIECEVITSFHQDESNFRNETPRNFYKNFEAGIHAIYIGEVIGAWKK